MVAQDITDATGVIDLNEEEYPVLSRILNGKSWGDVYKFGMGVQDSAAVAALSVINPVLGKVGSVLLSASSGTQAMLDAVERGGNDEQALTMGMLTGFFDMFFEEFGVKRLLEADDYIVKGLSNQMLSEFVDGGLAEFSNLASDYLIMAKNSNYAEKIQFYLAEHPSWSYEQDRGRFSVLTKHRDMVSWSRVMAYA